MMVKDKHLTINVSQDLVERLDETAEKLDSYRSRLVRAVLQDFVKDLEEGDSDIRELRGLFGFKRPLVVNHISYQKLKDKMEKMEE